MKIECFNIERDFEGVYYFLKEKGFSEKTITLLRKERGLIVINGNDATTKTKLKKGDKLQLTFLKEPSTFLEIKKEPQIIYEDDFLLAVNKPSGICSMPTRSHYEDNIAGQVLFYMKKKDKDFVFRLINRLDKDTAGILIIPKDIVSYQNLKEVQKTYFALCDGEILEDIVIDKKIETITKDGKNQLKRITSENGKDAKTFVSPIKVFDGYTLLKINLLHGRTHQIRVHLSSINHPLLGDEVYGKRSEKITHTALICKQIELNHPRTNKKISLEIDYPDDFKSLLK